MKLERETTDAWRESEPFFSPVEITMIRRTTHPSFQRGGADDVHFRPPLTKRDIFCCFFSLTVAVATLALICFFVSPLVSSNRGSNILDPIQPPPDNEVFTHILLQGQPGEPFTQALLQGQRGDPEKGLRTLDEYALTLEDVPRYLRPSYCFTRAQIYNCMVLLNRNNNKADLARAARNRWFTIGKQLVYEENRKPPTLLLKYLKALQESFEASDSETAAVTAANGTRTTWAYDAA